MSTFATYNVVSKLKRSINKPGAIPRSVGTKSNRIRIIRTEVFALGGHEEEALNLTKYGVRHGHPGA